IGNVSHLSFQNSSASLNDDAISVSSAIANLQQLDIGKEEPVMPSTEDHSAVVLPNHFQALVTDCSHLSFGTYTSGIASSSPMAMASNPTESNLEVSVGDGSSTVHSSFRNSEDSYDDQRGFMYDNQRVTADARNYDPPVSSQTKPMKQDFPEVTCGHQYISPSSVPDSSAKNIQQSDSNFPFVLDSNARSLPSVTGELRSEPTPSDSLELLHQSLETTYPSPFLETQLMPSGYATAVSSVNNHTIPMPEVLNSGSFWPQLSPQALPGSNLANRIVLPQRQHVHPYSQPTRPSNEFSHMIAYPSMAQTQAYVPSALRQAYPERSRFHDARAGMNYNLSQYRSIDPMGGLPPSYNRPSAYGNFVESSSNIPGSFPRNLSPSLMGSGVGHDGRHSVYQDGNRFTPHQQWYENNLSSSIRDLGGNPQRMSMPSASPYYHLLEQNQHRMGYQHDQQASQHYESPGYPNTYHSEMFPTTRSW
ncbi:GBF-interacting protein 1-like, partial [Melia azedarach]